MFAYEHPYAEQAAFVELGRAEDCTSETPIDMHEVIKSQNMPRGISNPKEVAKAILNADWLPYAAEAYSISSDLRDFIIVPTTIFLTDIPNANLAAFPFDEMSSWNPHAGQITYKTWIAKPCLSGDALVPTDKGIIPIRDIPSMRATHVRTKDGMARIKGWAKTGYGATYTVKTLHGSSVRATANHPFLVLEPSCILRWKDVADLKRGDMLVISSASLATGSDDLSYAMTAVNRIHNQTFTFVSKTGNTFERPKHQIVNTHKFPEAMTPELARVLGYLVSEGSITKRSIGFCNTDSDLVNDYVTCWEACFGEKPSVYRKSNERSGHGHLGTRSAKKDLYVVKFARHDVVAWFNSIGLESVGCHDRQVPASILRASPQFRREFLQAYIEGDGCLSGNRLGMFTVSRKLADHLKIVADSVGAITSVKVCRNIDVARNRRALWSVTVLNRHTFMQTIGTVSDKRGGILDTWRSEERLSTKRGMRRLYVPFVKKWAIKTASQHRVGHGKAVTYYDQRGRALDVRLAIDAEFTRPMDDASVSVLADQMAVLDPSYAERIRALIGDFTFDAVESVKATGVHEPVFDIETTAGQFVANSIVVHNCHLEHANSDPTKAKGVIFDSSMRRVPNLVGGLHRVVLLSGWDRNRDAALAGRIGAGRTGFSMGSWVTDYSCSVCNASLRKGGCSHIHPKQGILQSEASGKLVYRIARGCTGFELSSVSNAAFRSAYAKSIG